MSETPIADQGRMRDPIPYCVHKGKPCHEQSPDWNHTALCNAQHHAESLQVAARIVQDLAALRIPDRAGPRIIEVVARARVWQEQQNHTNNSPQQETPNQ